MPASCCAVKPKHRADLHRISQQQVTGLDDDLWRCFTRLESGGFPVLVLFVHEIEGEIRGDRFSRLENYINHRWNAPPGHYQTGCTYLRYGDLPLVAPLSDLGSEPQA
jgi:hypothetical protein